MIGSAMWTRAQEFMAQGVPFVTATVVRVDAPTSVTAGDVALVLADGTIDGFVGGVCTEHSVREHSLEAMRTGEPVLLKITPFAEHAAGDGDAQICGSVTVQNPCLSGGSVELLLEPVVPARRVLVVGQTPIADALVRIGGELDLEMSRVAGPDVGARVGDLGLVVAGHGRDELQTLRGGLEAGLPYVGLVASSKRGVGVIAELRGDGVAEDHLSQIDVPAGLDIGARTPAEVALSILARIVEVRRSAASSGRVPPAADTSVAPPSAVDPVCGMTVAVMKDTPSVLHDGETIYFCCDGCRNAFVTQHQHAGHGA